MRGYRCSVPSAGPGGWGARRNRWKNTAATNDASRNVHQPQDCQGQRRVDNDSQPSTISACASPERRPRLRVGVDARIGDPVIQSCDGVNHENADSLYGAGPRACCWRARARAQTLITRDVVDQPVETVRTVTITRTVRPVSRTVVRRQVITTRQTVLRQRIAPSQTLVARTVTAPRPLYDEVRPASMPVAPVPAYSRPLYDEVVPASDDSAVGAAPVATPPVVGPSGTGIPFYRYVYEPDRILVIDPTTNVAVETIPR
jgi:hypothetical protein